jgi:hypothetical protein
MVNIDTTRNEVSGSILDWGGMSGRFGGYTTYFVARFSQPLANWGTWNGNVVVWSGNVQNATRSGSDPLINIGAYVGWSAQSGVNKVDYVLGISSNSIEQARQNIDLEIRGRTFDAVLQETHNIWEAQMNRIQVQGGINNDEIVKFYSVRFVEHYVSLSVLSLTCACVQTTPGGIPHIMLSHSFLGASAVWRCASIPGV